MPDLMPVGGQTIGPFFGYALPYEGGPDLVPPGTPGAVRLRGRVLDGDGQPVPDALVEVWHPAPDGGVPRAEGSLHRDGWTFTGWGRAATDAAGRYAFSTLEPGVAEGGTTRWFAVTVFARGLLNRLFTRAYLPADAQPAPLDDDALLSTVEPARRETLIVRPSDDGYVFDIRLQGTEETVFLRYPQHQD